LIREAVAAACLLLAATGCNDGDDRAPAQDEVVPGPGPAKVDVATPDLVALKKQIGMTDCEPGAGGGHLPKVTLACLGGGPAVDVSSLRGPLVLSFWAAWCEQCRQEMPVLQQFHQEHGDQVPVLGIDWLDPYPGSALELAGDAGATYPSLADPGGELQGTQEFARITGLPFLALVDAAGEVAYAQFGVIDSTDELADLVDEHLGVAL
jgi:thiol-disulfide isomerase/thioredoxin